MPVGTLLMVPLPLPDLKAWSELAVPRVPPETGMTFRAPVLPVYEVPPPTLSRYMALERLLAELVEVQ